MRGSRPDLPQYHERKAFGDQVVEARLWQDPFAAVAAYQNAGKVPPETATNEPSAHTLPALREQISRRLTNSAAANDRVLVMLQMVSGGPYLEDAETRVRARNAVVSALAQAGYVPWDEEHIDFLTTAWPKGAELTGAWTNRIAPLKDSGSTNLALAVPFEWFQPNELHLASPGRVAPSNHVLVCWLPREAFDDHPLKRLSQLIASLHPETGETNGDPKQRFQLFDPNLRATVQEFDEQGPRPTAGEKSLSPAQLLTGLQIYSSWSTEADALVAPNATGRRRENVWKAFDEHHIAFTNVTTTDDELVEELIRELKLRGVDLVRDKASIALISEWDSQYGRALPLTFAAKLVQLQRRDQRRLSQTNLQSVFADLHGNAGLWPTNVLRCNYLRGLDGKLPGEKFEKKTSEGKSRAEELEGFERPEGPSQLDHVPRLAVELVERDQDAKREGRLRLRAIGVLGSDVYDKLLLIQALRSRFPGCLFFTVDLDARLFHPTELSWTRNLLVASSFDLELHESLQDPIPPFRDRHQTSLFLACLVALGQVTNDLQRIHPELFEVGHHGAYVLGVEGDKAEFNPFYSARPQPLPAKTVLVWACGLVLAFLLILVFSPKLRDWLAPPAGSQPALRRWPVVGAVVQLVYFPFIMLLLMLVSRTTYFDRWDWPWSLVAVIGIICLHALGCAIVLHRAAEKARQMELGRLKGQLLTALGKGGATATEPIRELIKQIESLREGVFAPTTQQPFFRAILLTLGGVGSVPLANFLPSLLGLSL